MSLASDPRIAVVFTGFTAADAYLAEVGQAVPAGAYVVRFAVAEAIFGHVTGCICCAPRGPVAAALTAMFRARAIGQAPFFSRVAIAASAAGQIAVREAMADVIVSARYRLG